MREYADLEVVLNRRHAEEYEIEFRFSQPNSDADIRIGQDQLLPAAISLKELEGLTFDPLAYGKMLTNFLFADAYVHNTFSPARAIAESLGIPLRLRLTIGASALELHSLHWETLLNPLDGSPLTTNENLLFSRYLSSQDWKPVRLRDRGDLYALVVAANPSNLDPYNLAPIDVEGELDRVERGLAGIPVKKLPDPSRGRPASLDFLLNELRSDRCNILYLICHGSLVRNESWLWLEGADGKAARISGTELVTRLKELEERPHLVVLASPESGRSGTGDVLTGLGFRMVRAGIPAVLAMLGKVSLGTIAEFMPVFFHELQHDGQIDRAMAVARGSVRQRPDYWMPALFTSLKSGRLFLEPTTARSAGVSAQGDLYAEYVAGRDIYVGFTTEQVARLLKEFQKAEVAGGWNGCPPYLGLEAFGVEHAGLFFGREKLVEQLLGRVGADRFVCIAGPSGSGKSSLARAGLIHALKEGRLEGSQDWLTAVLVPRSDPFVQLRLALTRTALNAGLSSGVVGFIRESGLEAADALNELAEILVDGPRSRRLVIFVDQFEELFTQSGERERAGFIQLLTGAAGAVEGRVTIVIALRSDFLSHCSAHPELTHLINRQFQLVGAMEPEDLARAIALPVLEVGAAIDPELVRGVVIDTRGEPGALPLMQFALKDLFDSQTPRQGEAILLTWKDYLNRGGMHQALENHAEALMQKLAGKEKLVRVLFSRLVQVRSGAEATRRTETFEHLIESGLPPADLKAMIQVLSDARLVVTGTNEAEGQRDDSSPGLVEGEGPSTDRSATITLAHERLIEAWPWLKRLVEEKRADLALAGQVDDDAAAWLAQTKEKKPDYLYRGAKLAGVLTQLEEKRIQLSERAELFLAASRSREWADTR